MRFSIPLANARTIFDFVDRSLAFGPGRGDGAISAEEADQGASYYSIFDPKAAEMLRKIATTLRDPNKSHLVDPNHDGKMQYFPAGGAQDETRALARHAGRLGRIENIDFRV